MRKIKMEDEKIGNSEKFEMYLLPKLLDWTSKIFATKTRVKIVRCIFIFQLLVEQSQAPYNVYEKRMFSMSLDLFIL